MKLWKYSGTYLTITGMIHTLVALGLNWNIYKAMWLNGLSNSIGNDFTKAFALWFFICGILLIFLGQTLQHYLKKEGLPAPLFLGYAILIFSIIGCIIEPVSGFWLFLPQALIIILAKREKRKL